MKGLKVRAVLVQDRMVWFILIPVSVGLQIFFLHCFYEFWLNLAFLKIYNIIIAGGTIVYPFVEFHNVGGTIALSILILSLELFYLLFLLHCARICQLSLLLLFHCCCFIVVFRPEAVADVVLELIADDSRAGAVVLLTEHDKKYMNLLDVPDFSHNEL